MALSSIKAGEGRPGGALEQSSIKCSTIVLIIKSQVAVYFPGFFLLGALSIITGFMMIGMQGRLYARISGV